MNPFRKWLACVLAAGFALVSTAALSDDASTVTGAQLEERIRNQDDILILDVRTPEEFASGHVPGARNIPHDQLPSRIAEIVDSKDREVIVYCRSGKRAALAQEVLAEKGFQQITHLEGDMLKWQEEGRPVEK
jgi:phage shock protein E